MKQKDLIEKLKGIRVFNEYGITSDGNPFIHVRGTRDSRDVTPPAVVLSLKGRKFTKVAWFQMGSLWFSYSNKAQRDEAIQDAMNWVEKRFPGMKMVKSPFNRFAWVPEVDLEKAIHTALVE